MDGHPPELRLLGKHSSILPDKFNLKEVSNVLDNTVAGANDADTAWVACTTNAAPIFARIVSCEFDRTLAQMDNQDGCWLSPECSQPGGEQHTDWDMDIQNACNSCSDEAWAWEGSIPSTDLVNTKEHAFEVLSTDLPKDCIESLHPVSAQHSTCAVSEEDNDFDTAYQCDRSCAGAAHRSGADAIAEPEDWTSWDVNWADDAVGCATTHGQSSDPQTPIAVWHHGQWTIFSLSPKAIKELGQNSSNDGAFSSSSSSLCCSRFSAMKVGP